MCSYTSGLSFKGQPMSIHAVTITELEHHNDRVMFFSVTKPEGFHFQPGQFVRCGVALVSDPKNEEDFLMRPYSIASHPQENRISFYVARVLDGALTPKLFDLKVGDTLYLDDTAYGLMLPSRLEAGGTLICFASGTGLSAFLSIVKDNPWKRFDNVVVVHCARCAKDITLTDAFSQAVHEQGRDVNFRFIAATTREPDPTQCGEINKRVPQAIVDGDFEKMGFTLTPQWVRAMICGNPAFVNSMKKVLKDRGFNAPRGEKLGTYVAENFW